MCRIARRVSDYVHLMRIYVVAVDTNEAMECKALRFILLSCDSACVCVFLYSVIKLKTKNNFRCLAQTRAKRIVFRAESTWRFSSEIRFTKRREYEMNVSTLCSCSSRVRPTDMKRYPARGDWPIHAINKFIKLCNDGLGRVIQRATEKRCWMLNDVYIVILATRNRRQFNESVISVDENVAGCLALGRDSRNTTPFNRTLLKEICAEMVFYFMCSSLISPSFVADSHECLSECIEFVVGHGLRISSNHISIANQSDRSNGADK